MTGRAARTGAGGAGGAPVPLALPLPGPVRVVNSPADRVPSHGTELFGLGHAVDLVPVDARGRSARRDLRSWLREEPPDQFVGFGQAVRAPAAGTVVAAHDGEPDGPARRAPLARLSYAATQVQRVRAGIEAVAGNHVVVELAGGRGYLWLVHLRRGSVRAVVGNRVVAGDLLGECGSSGNATEPHVHLHVADVLDPDRARGVPIVLTGYRVRHPAGGGPVAAGMPRTGEVVEPVADGSTP